MNHPGIKPGTNTQSAQPGPSVPPARPSKELIVKHLLRSVALGAALIVVIIGCGGSSAAPSASSVPGASSSALAAPSSAARSNSPAAVASPPAASPSEFATASSPTSLPSLPAIFSNHADPTLESLLPAEVSGIAMQRYSLTLSDVLDAGGDRAAIDAFLAGIGKAESDGSFAAALDPTNTLTGGILAFKVSGADTARLLGGIVSVEQSDLGTGATTRQATVGGKGVTIVSVGTGPNDTEWIYGRGDVVFVVHADDETRAAAFLQALP